MENIIEIRNLRKSFGAVRAVDDISFNVEKGSLFAFLGLNGAGKSTTINILCSTLVKDGGEAVINGMRLDDNAEAIKRDIGIVFQNSVLDSRLSVKDNLVARAAYYGLRGEPLKSRICELVELLDLTDILNRPLKNLSGGQRRRIDIARALLHKPKLLFLDEPTTGLDPKTRQTVWEILENLMKETGMTVFLTTHYMEEANRADRVVIIDGGKIVADDTPIKLKDRFSGDYIKIYTEKSEEFDGFLTGEAAQFFYKGECYMVKVDGSGEAKKFILKNSDRLNNFEVIKGNMDDVFLNATGKTLGGENA